jgi:hypothetical protein
MPQRIIYRISLEHSLVIKVTRNNLVCLRGTNLPKVPLTPEMYLHVKWNSFGLRPARQRFRH